MVLPAIKITQPEKRNIFSANRKLPPEKRMVLPVGLIAAPYNRLSNPENKKPQPDKMNTATAIYFESQFYNKVLNVYIA